MPLRHVALVGTERDFRVDRGRAADAPAREERDQLPVRERREPQRPEEIVRSLRLPAGEVGRPQMRAALEQEDVTPALRELARKNAASGARPDHDDVEGVSHADSQVRPVLLQARASGELKSISAHAPGPSLPGATKSE